METKSKDQILAKLSAMLPEDIEKLRNEKLIDYKFKLAEYFKVKDDLLTSKHTKRKELIGEGNSVSKTEILLRGDEDLFNKKRLVMALANAKKNLELELELLESYFWGNKK